MRRKTIGILTTSLAVLGMVWMAALSRGAPGSRLFPQAAAELQPLKTPARAEKGKDAVPAAPSKQVARLTRVSIRPSNVKPGTQIDLATSQPVPYQVLHLTNPNRLVLDLKGAQNATDQWKFMADSPYLVRVRLGRFSEEDGGVVRVVADLNGDPAYDVARQPTGLRIDLKPASGGLGSNGPATLSARLAAAVVQSAKITPEPRLPQSPIQQAAATPESRLPVKSMAAIPVHTELARAPEASAIPSSNGSLPASSGSQPEAKSVISESIQAAKAARVVAHTTGQNPASATPDTGPATEPRYTGERISLNLKEVDLKDFFRLIHQISGLNIIIDPNVSGSVTTTLDDVPWDQALDIVLRDNGLGKQLDGNILRIAKISTLTAEQQQEQQLAEAKVQAAPLVTVFRSLSYAKATALASLLKSWTGGGGLSRRGTVMVDDRTNTLIISDIPSQIPLINSVINKLDKKAQQVSIEARIIRATSDFARNLGVALSYAQNNPSKSLVTGGATGVNVSAQPLSPPTITTGTATGFGVFVISNLGANYAINAAIAAAESRDEAKTISRPSIVTQNNIQGIVVQGTQIPIQTTINNTISVQYVQASLQLTVTPQVTQDGHIFLTIDVQNSSPGPALTLAGPTINTQSATTQILVPDGGTVVFGGVTVSTRSKSFTGIPLLGSIPVLGHLFQNSVVQNDDQELLFFVTPKVLPT